MEEAGERVRPKCQDARTRRVAGLRHQFGFSSSPTLRLCNAKDQIDVGMRRARFLNAKGVKHCALLSGVKVHTRGVDSRRRSLASVEQEETE
jgi:hypothetical protein